MAHNLDRSGDQEPQASADDDSDRPERRDEHRSRLDRRSYIKYSGLIGAALAATTVSSADGSTVRDGIEFPHRLHAVEDLDLDPTGETPVDRALEAVQDGSLIVFPDGNYRFESTPFDGSPSREKMGLEGIGDAVRFVSQTGSQRFLLDWEGMQSAYFENIDIDQRAVESCAGVRILGERVVIRDVDVIGGCDRQDGGLPVISHATSASQGHSLVDNVSSTATSDVRPALGRPGIFVDPAHRGTVTVRNCELSGFPDPAVYGARHSGSVQIRDSYFENNAASIRLSNGGSSLRGSTIRVDELPPAVSAANERQFHHHGVAVATDEPDGSVSEGTESLSIEETTFEIGDLPGFYPAIVIPSGVSLPEIRDCHIEYGNDSQTVILARNPGTNDATNPTPLRIRNLSVTGEGDVDSVIEVGAAYRPEISDSTVRMSNGNAVGLLLSGASGFSLENTTVGVPNRPIVVTDEDNSTLQQQYGCGHDSCLSRANTLCIEGDGTAANYELTASGPVERNVDSTAAYGPSGRNTEGTVSTDAVRLSFDGRLTDFRVDGTATLTLEQPGNLTDQCYRSG